MEWIIIFGFVALAVALNISKNKNAGSAKPGAIKTVMVKGNLSTDVEVQRYTKRGWELLSVTGAGRKKVVLTFKKLDTVPQRPDRGVG